MDYSCALRVDKKIQIFCLAVRKILAIVFLSTCKMTVAKYVIAGERELEELYFSS